MTTNAKPKSSNTPLRRLSGRLAKGETKASIVEKLLRRSQGATLGELVDATGWLPHTTRAALTGLRKKGHSLVKTKRGNSTCYQIPPGAAQSGANA